VIYGANLLMVITLKDLEIDFGYTLYNVFWIGCKFFEIDGMDVFRDV
jgi:hypothetical protein